MEIGKRTRISDNQRDILEKFYGRGMVGVGLNYREMIESAVSSNNDSSYKGKIYRYHSDVNVDYLLLKTLDDTQKYTNIN
jgi:hypothetical protein